MKKLLLASLILVFCINSFAQKQKKKKKTKSTSKTVLEIGNKQINTDDFLYVYKKNRKEDDSNYSYADLSKYMDLYINFQLKVIEAEAQGLDTLPSFIKEFEGYRKKLAKPYLTDEGFTKEWAKTEYNRQKEEINASHILIKISSEKATEDTLKAYKKIVKIKKEIEAGLDFGQAAIKYSDDPSAQMEDYPIGYKGNLGYFSAFDMVFEFENAAFQNPVGSLVGPIKTQFGYHLLKIKDRRSTKPKRDVSHIMILAADKISTEDSLAAVKKIKAIRSELNGNNWDEICKKFSEHAKSKDKGGQLGIIKVGGKLGSPEFENIAFSLKKTGDISQPVKTAYGWHIIKYNAEVSIPSYAEQEKELITKVSKNGAIVEMGKLQFAEKIKKENDFQENMAVLEKAKTIPNSTYLTKDWSYDKENPELESILFKISNVEYSVQDLLNYLEKSRSWYIKKSIESIFLKDYENFKIKKLFEFQENSLVSKYPNYKHLVQEYRDGILLFDLMNNTIWKKSASDTVALQNYFENNKDQYKWGNRAKSVVYYLYDTTKSDQLSKLLLKGETPTEEDFNANSSLTLKIKNITIEKGSNDEDFNNMKWETGIQEFTKSDYKIFINVAEVNLTSNKLLKESKGQVISDYQVQLESDWIGKLKKKHDYKMYDKVLKSLSTN